MARFVSTIRPAPGGDGPFYVVTETLDGAGGTVTNVTTGVANISAALDQAKADQGSLLGGLTFKRATIATDAAP